jgi:hypothetical protein
LIEEEEIKGVRLRLCCSFCFKAKPHSGKNAKSTIWPRSLLRRQVAALNSQQSVIAVETKNFYWRCFEFLQSPRDALKQNLRVLLFSVA